MRQFFGLTRAGGIVEVPPAVVHEVGHVVVIGIRPPVVLDAARALGQALLGVGGVADAGGVLVVVVGRAVAARAEVDGELACRQADAGDIARPDVVLGGA